MNSHKFSVGQAIVCLNDCDHFTRWACEKAGIIIPKKNGIYHVRENLVAQLGPAIRLVEIINPPFQFANAFVEASFLESDFAPVELLPADALAELLECLEPQLA